ncbi:MAG: SusC/RagA family TonB-linked outer membrane protein [Sphingobacteriales bacterium]
MKKKLRFGRLAVLLLATVSIIAITFPGFAQEAKRKITGTIIGTNDLQPLPGVSIKIKGTTVVTVSDTNGLFNIAAKTGDVLILTYVGYDAQQVTVGQGNTINVKLTPSNQALNEVIVVGFGTQKKKVLTGATVHVSSENLNENHVVSVTQALQGQVAGVQITSNSGQPGDPLKFSIRGIGTNGDSSPLYIVDGVPTNDISYINPSDVESVDVLKDAASTAIYGVEAANGVVIISTKKGKAGKMQVTLDSYYGVQNPAKRLDMLNGYQYGVIMNESAINSGKAPFFSLDSLKKLGAGTDWQKAATNKNAPMESYSLGLTGGNDQSVFSSSLSYQKQQGIMGLPGQSVYERTSFRINSDHKVYKDYVHIGENLTYSHVPQSGIATGNIYGNSIRGLLNTDPTFPVHNADGSYARGNTNFNANEVNPIAAMAYQNNSQTVTDRIVGDAYGQAAFLKYFKFRSDFGLDLSYISNQSYNPVYTLSTLNYNAISSASQSLSRYMTWNFDNTLTYQQQLGKNSITALVGTTARARTGFWLNGSKQNLLTPSLYNAVIDNGQDKASEIASGSESRETLESYFGRLLYNYDEKYLFTAVIRRDGSSQFGSNNRYGNFPSVSAGWVATNEDFLKGVNWLNFFKIRAGWGQNGNDKIGDYKYLAAVSSAYKAYYFNGVQAVGTSPDYIANPNLKWETSQQTDIGFDATVFKSLVINFDYYDKQTKDWLVAPPIPALAGTGAPTINGGNIQNKGIEIALTYNHTFGKVYTAIGGNIAFNRNKVLSIPNQDGIIHPAYNGVLGANIGEYYRMQTGYPVGYFYGLKTAGIFQNQAQIDAYTHNGVPIQPGAQPGDVRFVDVNGDGKIDASDNTMIGNPNPKATYGFNINARYKGFDIAILFNGVYGNQVVDGTRSYADFTNNYTTAVFGSWTGEGTSNRLPRVTEGDEVNNNWGQFSDLYVFSGSFLRLKSVNIGYDFKKGEFKNLPFQQLRLYVSGTNLCTFTKYRGLDPEIGYGIDPWSSGTDLGYYPQPRTLLIGLNVKF